MYRKSQGGGGAGRFFKEPKLEERAEFQNTEVEGGVKVRKDTASSEPENLSLARARGWKQQNRARRQREGAGLGLW